MIEFSYQQAAYLSEPFKVVASDIRFRGSRFEMLKLVQLLVVADSELEMTGNDTRLLVVAGGVASQLEDLCSKVFKNGSEVDWSTSTDSLSVVALSEESVNTTNWESKAGLGGTTVHAS